MPEEVPGADRDVYKRQVHNLPRTTAQGIYNQCAIISPSEAKPGDIIFFTGTYDSPGPVSHAVSYTHLDVYKRQLMS